MTILIKNADVLLLENEKLLVEKKDIVVKDGIIEHIGHVTQEDYDKVIDGNNKLAMPGLINMHTHLSMSLLRNYAEDMELEEWLRDKILPIESKFIPEDVYWGTTLSIAELIMSGVTCFNDMYFYEDEIAKAVVESKIRANLAIPFVDYTRNDEMIFEKAKVFYHQWNNSNNGRITISLGPDSLLTVSGDYYEKVIALARELGASIHTHISETKQQVEDCIKKRGKTQVKYLKDLGLFDGKVLAAHCVHVTDEDIKILREHDVYPINNPGSNMKLADGFAPVQKMLDAGLHVCLGTDGSSSNNNVNLFEEMHLAAILNKGISGDPTAVKASDVIKMATINGAKALGKEDEIGSIQEGKKADIILIDLDKPHFLPRNNLIYSLVYCAQAADVDTVMVDGHLLMEDRKLITIDMEIVKKNIHLCTQRLFKKK